MLGVVLTEAFDFFEARGAVGKGKDKQVFVPPHNMKELLETKQVRPFEHLSRQQIRDMGVPEEDIDALLRPCKVPVHINELIKLYQKELKRSSEGGQIKREDLEALFIKIYSSKAFEVLNGSKELVDGKMVYTKGLLKRPYDEFLRWSSAQVNPADAEESNMDKIISGQPAQGAPGLMEHLLNLLSDANMEKEFPKRLDKAFNMIFANQSVEVPKGNERTISSPGTGFPAFEENGRELTASELTQIQINSLKAFVYKQHLLNPGRKFVLMFIEAGEQHKKIEEYTKLVDTINNYVELKQAEMEKGTHCEKAYHQMMNELATMKLEVKDRGEYDVLSYTQRQIAKNSVEVLGLPNSGLRFTGAAVDLEFKMENDEDESAVQVDVVVKMHMPDSPRSAHVSQSVFNRGNNAASSTTTTPSTEFQFS